MKTYNTLIMTVILGITLSLQTLKAQNDTINFESYLQGFKTITFSDITQQFLEGNPHQKLTPMTTPEALKWVVRPCIFEFVNYQKEGHQGLGQSIVDEIEQFNKEFLEAKSIKYYKYGRVRFSEKYVSLLYFYLDEGQDLQCLLINYSTTGKTIDGLVIGKCNRNRIYADYEVDVAQIKPQNTLYIRNLTYRRDKEGRVGGLRSDVDHYFQIQENGRVLSIQSKYYPCHGFFKDRRGNTIKMTQNKHGAWGRYLPKSGYGLGETIDKIKQLTIGKSFKIEIDEKEYQATFTSKNKIKLSGPKRRSWVFTRRRKK